jgi:hypothetical protein
MDLSTGQQSPVATVSADTGTVNAGQLTACSGSNPGATVQNITYTLAGVPYTIMTPVNTVGYSFDSYSAFSNISGRSSSTEIDIRIGQLTATGIYTNDSIYLTVPTGAYNGLVTSTITAFGPIDAYIQGTFTGSVATYGGQPQTISGSFYVQRTN